MTTEEVALPILERVSLKSLTDFLMETCRVAIECGCSSNRIETLVTRLGEAWGYQVESAATPTAVWLSVHGRGQHSFELVRVRSWSINLERLALLNDLVDEVENKRVFLDEAVDKLKVISVSPNPYPRWLTLLAGGGSSVAIVFTSGGRELEIIFAMLLGILCQLSMAFFASGNRRYLADFFTAMGIAFAASAAEHYFPAMDMPRLIIGGLISLVPGLVFVNSLHEVAQKNLSSGSARILEALVIAFNLSFGVAAALGFVKYAVRFW